MKNLLLVENDLNLSRGIIQSLSSQNISIQTASSLESSYTLLEKINFHVAVIDRILDDGDGIELVEYIAQFAPEINILVISKKSEQLERLKGIRAGAIDYLPKPLQMDELRLKVAKLSKLKYKKPEQKIRINGLELDLNSGVLTIGSSYTQLRRREVDLLQCFMSHPNQVMSRDQLINHVWGSLGELPLYSTLDVYVRRIRIRLGSNAKMLETVRGFGYVLKTKRISF
jgi:DNA-binding response OmpR family regulator